MGSSDWGDWLPRTIADATPRGVGIWYLGCNGFVLKASDGTTIFIDPYLGTGDPPRTIRMIPVPFDPEDIKSASAILVTHDHTDHVHGPSQAPILEQTGATLFGPSASIDVAIAEESWPAQWDIKPDQFTEVAVEDTFDVGSFSITVCPAHDPDAAEPVSYLIEHEVGTIFHGGDTKPTTSFEEIGERFDIDLAIGAFGTVGNLRQKHDPSIRRRTRWYCDENELIEIANALRAERLLPSHWDMWKGVGGDPTVLHYHAASWPYPRRIEIVEIGDRIDLSPNGRS